MFRGERRGDFDQWRVFSGHIHGENGRVHGEIAQRHACHGHVHVFRSHVHVSRGHVHGRNRHIHGAIGEWRFMAPARRNPKTHQAPGGSGSTGLEMEDPPQPTVDEHPLQRLCMFRPHFA
jgi:hypothetical protein